jgi:AMMECR1 domain-containing protein
VAEVFFAAYLKFTPPRLPGRITLMLFKLAKTCIFSLICLMAIFSVSFQAHAAVPSAQSTAEKEPLTLTDVVRKTIAVHFGELKLNGQTIDQFASSLPVSKQFQRPAGVFVTLSHNGQTRACWGSITPSQSSIVKQTVYATLDALTKEYRYTHIKQYEWKKLKPQVTVITGVEPISTISFQNPLRDGLLVRSGGKAGVYLPGEAADAHYQLVHCKLKAGIKPGEPCQLYRLRTEIYE